MYGVFFRQNALEIEFTSVNFVVVFKWKSRKIVIYSVKTIYVVKFFYLIQSKILIYFRQRVTTGRPDNRQL